MIAALIAALLFAVHPQHVESVAWIAERKDLLCQLFLLLAMLTYVKYVVCPEEVKTRWFNTTLGFFFMALLSKPMAVTFPVVLLLMDVYPLRRFAFVKSINPSIKQQNTYVLLREKLPFFLLTIALILITLLAQQEALKSRPFDLKLLNAFNSIIFYLTQLWVPINFSPLYPYFVEVGEKITWRAFIPMFAVVGITSAALFAWAKGRHAWLIAWMFYLVTLSPVLGVIQVGQQGAADRYAYLPTLPIYLFIGAGILFVLTKANSMGRVILLLTTSMFIFLLVEKTKEQIGVWKSPLTLWSHAVKYDPDNVGARHNLAISYLNQEEYEKAAFYFGENINSREKPIVSWAWRALSYLLIGNYDDAIHDYAQLGKLSSTFSEVNLDQNCFYFNTAWGYAKSGMFNESQEFFQKIEKNSYLLPNAEIWLEWLENRNSKPDSESDFENLPNLCTKLFLPKWKYQANHET